MINLVRPDISSAARDRRRPTKPASRRPGFWQRLVRLATTPLGELLRPRPERSQALAARRERRAAPARSVPVMNPMHAKAADAVREMQAKSECLLPNWLSSVEIREYSMSETVLQRLFGTGPSA